MTTCRERGAMHGRLILIHDNCVSRETLHTTMWAAHETSPLCVFSPTVSPREKRTLQRECVKTNTQTHEGITNCCAKDAHCIISTIPIFEKKSSFIYYYTFTNKNLPHSRLYKHISPTKSTFLRVIYFFLSVKGVFFHETHQHHIC